MALYLQKESKVALYLAAREELVAPLNFENDWTEIRCGAFISGCRANDEATNALNDRVGFEVDLVTESVSFGIKNSDSEALPGEAGSVYLGIRTAGTAFNNQSMWEAYQMQALPIVANTSIGDASRNVSACGYDGTTLVDGGILAVPPGLNPGVITETGAIHFTDYSSPVDYCGFYVIKFVINNRGLASQTVGISISSKSPIEGFDYTPFALQQEMNGAEFGPTKTIAWNNGGVAREIPDAFYIRLPFYSNRIMLAAIRAIKYQPQ